MKTNQEKRIAISFQQTDAAPGEAQWQVPVTIASKRKECRPAALSRSIHIQEALRIL